ncbi:MAG: coproporphyrinogen dehydrogenase HemZ [Tissierellia bacterium]|nr:coproporphyrinogen dehydrogenase HemZ [Tissierellia bacterium]
MISVNTLGFDNHKDYYELVRAFFSDYELEGVLKAEFRYYNNKFVTNILLDDRLYEHSQNTGKYFEKMSKNFFKREIYEAIKYIFNKSLPWGSLTGIRPVKLVREIMEAKKGSAYEILLKEYNISKEKIELSKSISDLQYKILNSLPSSYSIYINIPFCPSICKYCSFPTYKYSESMAELYIKNLIKEIKTFENLREEKPNSIYIGGGTPTALSYTLLDGLLENIIKIYGNDFEFTVEAGRADTIDRNKLKILKEYGVNRISINPQTFNRDSLIAIGREQEDEAIYDAFYLAKTIGFNSINADLISGLPKDNYESFSNTLLNTVKLEPDNITIHALSVKNGSQIYNIGGYKNPEYEKMDKLSREFMRKNNYFPYYLYRQKRISGASENIGYSIVGKECIYNIVMMEDTDDIIAFGLGGVSKRIFDDGRIIRQPNFRGLREYNERFDEIISKKRILFDLED